ncbi:uncharacterized protein LY89DRAFT_789108 [Mollisia scopiformis]|uniref:Uncharacterized protein n=1 Tax=Mollisia scopiformis TaxID=149040 RepID=A0A132B8H0_MOLSC|nr:uncharacterized protein LY89DRAFT_789108 [Mollisia scopiformis]KUJ08289.1 hypothetical protein LY89DRAFT_789108 [Mollisia scopiformis]
MQLSNLIYLAIGSILPMSNAFALDSRDVPGPGACWKASNTCYGEYSGFYNGHTYKNYSYDCNCATPCLVDGTECVAVYEPAPGEGDGLIVDCSNVKCS